MKVDIYSLEHHQDLSLLELYLLKRVKGVPKKAIFLVLDGKLISLFLGQSLDRGKIYDVTLMLNISRLSEQ